jgi:hypothetical protein
MDYVIALQGATGRGVGLNRVATTKQCCSLGEL